VSPGNANLSKIDRRCAESDSVSQHEFEVMAAVEVGDGRESDLKILCLAGKKEDDLGVGGRQNESRRNRRIHQTHAPFSKPGDLSRLVIDPQPNHELAMVLGGGFRDGVFVSVRRTANVRDADLHALIGQLHSWMLSATLA